MEETIEKKKPTRVSFKKYTILQDYISYVEDKVEAGEMPFTFEQWTQAGIDIAKGILS